MHRELSDREIQTLRRAKRKINAVFCVVIVGLLVLVGFLALILPKPKESEVEKRELASFPEFSVSNLLSGKFTDDLGIYYSDTFPQRDLLVHVSFQLAEQRGIRYDDVKIYNGESGAPISPAGPDSDPAADQPPFQDGTTPPLQQPATDQPTPKLDEQPATPITPVKPVDQDPDQTGQEGQDTEQNLTGEQRGPLFLIGDKALELFYGNKQVNQSYVDAVNSYAKALPDVKVYDMIIPTHIEFGLPEKYKSVCSGQREFIDYIFDNLNDGIITVDPYDTLKEHYEDDEYVYFRSDHHWTGLGAYYAYTVFAEKAGFDPIPLETYETGTISPFLGTLYQSTMDTKLKENPDYVQYYLVDLPYTMTCTKPDGTSYEGKLVYSSVKGAGNAYLAFMGGDEAYIKITTENHNGRKLMIFKESFSNAFIPFLVPHFEEIHVADVRKFPYNSLDFIQNNNINEIMFINSIFTASTSARVDDLTKMMNRS